MCNGVIMVPGRLGSQRFPGKLLEAVGGRALIEWTALNLRKVSGGLPVVYAVGDVELGEILERMGERVVLTAAELASGTDRIAVANAQVGADWVINVQADEPVIAEGHIAALRERLEAGAEMVTVGTPFIGREDFEDPNKVKVVVGNDGRALYFSRAMVPWNRDSGAGESTAALWHLGIYGYSRATLARLHSLPQGRLERLEKLEQLRALENGIAIEVVRSATRTVGVDVRADLELLAARLASAEGQGE